MGYIRRSTVSDNKIVPINISLRWRLPWARTFYLVTYVRASICATKDRYVSIQREDSKGVQTWAVACVPRRVLRVNNAFCSTLQDSQ